MCVYVYIYLLFCNNLFHKNEFVSLLRYCTQFREKGLKKELGNSSSFKVQNGDLQYTIDFSLSSLFVFDI